ncbi:MAG TPA: MOSC N-terminal beta barrel domain-containing protein [Polyangiaceae bacterium]
MLRVRSLYVHPVKSLRGIGVQELQVERRGPRHDRRWLLVDETGRFITQREEPRLALVDVAIDDAARRLVVKAPGLAALMVPFEPSQARRRVVIWNDTVTAASVSAEAATYFTRYLGMPVDLVQMPDDVERAVDPRYGRPGDIVSFADAYPFLLVSQASHDDLCVRMGEAIPVTRFRPNIVVEGAPPYAEDGWTSLRIGPITFRVAKPCDRCPIPTIDIETGLRHAEPLKTLATYRKREHKVYFGQNLSHDGEGTVRVGDPVEATGAA